MDSVAQTAADSALTFLPEPPEELLDIPVNRLDTLFPGPTLIAIPGRRRRPLFVSVLLHGNEVTGLLAVQHLLRDYRSRNETLPRTMLLFIGNIQAAKYEVRRLAGQADFNRIWAGGNRTEHTMARQLIRHLREQDLFAAVDVHNNTGKNPMYACINRVEPAFVNLARRFSKTLVYFTEPHEVISMAMSRLCPAVTLECGLPGELEGIQRVSDYLRQCLELEEIPSAVEADEEVDVFHTVAKILVPEGATVGFGERDSRYTFCFPGDFETLNFHLLPHDFQLGWRYDRETPLRAVDNLGLECGDSYFHYEDDRILTSRTFLLSMLTRDVRVIYQDCLGYIMEHYPLEDPE